MIIIGKGKKLPDTALARMSESEVLLTANIFGSYNVHQAQLDGDLTKGLITFVAAVPMGLKLCFLSSTYRKTKFIINYSFGLRSPARLIQDGFVKYGNLLFEDKLDMYIAKAISDRLSQGTVETLIRSFAAKYDVSINSINIVGTDEQTPA